MRQPSKITNNKLTATQLLNYNTTDYIPNAIVIENVKPDDHNKKYLTVLILNIFTEYSKKKFLYTYSDLQNTDYEYFYFYSLEIIYL